jgi:hypothetical protein
VPDKAGGWAPRPSLNAQDPPPSRTPPSLADPANVVALDAWLLAHGRWAAWEAERSTWAPEWTETRRRLEWST